MVALHEPAAIDQPLLVEIPIKLLQGAAIRLDAVDQVGQVALFVCLLDKALKGRPVKRGEHGVAYVGLEMGCRDPTAVTTTALANTNVSALTPAGGPCRHGHLATGA